MTLRLRYVVVIEKHGAPVLTAYPNEVDTKGLINVQ